MSEGAIQKRMSRELESLGEQSQLRTLEITKPATGGINLNSNDYLGLSTDPRLKQALMEAVARGESAGSTGSRLLSGNSLEWEELESAFARFAGTEAALYFGSGYAANVGLLSSLLRPGDTVFSDALNHASLIDGIRLSRATKVIYPHGDMRYLEKALRERAADPGARAIVTESVFSMEGDVAPVGDLLDLARRYGAELVIDEAHAMGACGPQGRGIAAELGVEREALAIVYTCGKALASAGAFVCGRKTLEDYLINRARIFIFSTAMPPYLAGQIRSAISLAREAKSERAHLRRIASALREGLAAAGLNTGTSSTHIVPILLGSNEGALHVASELRRNGFVARAIRPPTVPPGTARIRISLTSRITFDDIGRLVAATDAACRSFARPMSGSAVHA
jgi:8-amino-7-oxononanoate synthase